MKTRATYDAEYERWRNSKIAEAAARADAAYPEPVGATAADLDAWRWRWDAAFLRHMDRLVGDPMCDVRCN